MIEARHIEEAARRWDDFQRIQGHKEPRHFIAAMKTMQLGLGLGKEASGAFWVEMEHRPIGSAASIAAVRAEAELTGLVVGLMARELAEEEASA